MSDSYRTAIVTGAGSGIGRASALALQRAGFNAVLAGRRREALEETAKLAQSGGPALICVPTDVSDEAAVVALFDEAKREFGRLDLLFNNAGLFIPGTPIEGTSLANWRAVIDVNLTGAFLCAREAVRMMKAQNPQGGRIINNGSISAHAPRPGSTSYTTSKHAITGLTKSLSLDGRAHNIACGQLDIGNATTQLVDTIRKGVVQASGAVVAEPVMDVEHCASAVVYMASLPLDANVQFMTIMATKMPFVGRG